MGDQQTTVNYRNERGGDEQPHYYRNDAAQRPRKTHKAVPKGHEAFLKALESSGVPVEFEKAYSGEKIVGSVKASDKFTISVRCVDRDGKSTTRVLFKHDISEFSPLYADGGTVDSASVTGLVGEKH